MPLRVAALRSLVEPLLDSDPPRSQNAVARELGIEPSMLSRWLAGGGASYQQVVRVARALGADPATLWDGSVPRRYREQHVPRGTHATVRERPPMYGDYLTAKDLRGALWALEQMSLAIADISRRARQATED